MSSIPFMVIPRPGNADWTCSKSQSMATEKRKGDPVQPCRTPRNRLIKSEVAPRRPESAVC
eukprot:5859904-Amphidinium_carterae.5